MYKDRYYNHFTGKGTILPPQFSNNENYLMRFMAPLSDYIYEENNLTVIYFKKGTGELHWHDKKVFLQDDKFVITNPGEGWVYHNRSGDYIDVLSFVMCDSFKEEFDFYLKSSSKQLLDTPFERYRADSFFLECPLSARYYTSGKLLQNIYFVSGTKNYQYLSPQEITIEVLQALCKDQLRAYSKAQKIEVAKSSTKMETFRRLLVAYEYIHDNFNRSFNLEELSRQCCLSKFHLYNSFKCVYGRTPHQYINRVRLNKARHYLKNKGLTVTEVSDALGFADIASFSKLYKKMYGESPSVLKYRNAETIKKLN